MKSCWKLAACMLGFSLLMGCLPTLARTPWTTSRVTGSPEPPPPYHVERVFPQLEFDNPVELMPLAQTGKMMILEVSGKLYTFDDDPTCDRVDLAIDLQPLIEDFRRAYGFAIHPDFVRNRQIFVAYAGDPVARPDGSRLSRFIVSDTEPFRVDSASEEVLLTWPSGGHNGCAIRFDSSGYLYFSTGDGARPFPPDEYDVSQDLSDLRSSICRIDVDRRDPGLAYAIPQDNPFLSIDGARPEIWAYGFRNPWRFTIAPGTDQIYCGDVGWELWELIFDVKRGGNYGWSLFEGPQPIRSDIAPGPTPVTKPIVAYPHALGQSVTGGHVYRGTAHPELRGAYLYGDYVTGLLWGLRHEEERVTWNPVLAETGLAIITFAETIDHEVLIVGYDGGIYRLASREASEETPEFPRSLSETGLFESMTDMKPATGVVSYKPTVTAWEDGAESDFVLGLPGLEPISISQRQRAWRFPEGTVFAKTISRDAKKLETQLLHFDGINWHPYSYQWNQDQSDAVLVDQAGTTMVYHAQNELGKDKQSSWTIHNRTQCRVCHSRQNGGAVGFSLENLSETQIRQFIQEGILDRAAPDAWNISSMVDPHDSEADLQSRARSYLAANCAHCHRRGGGGTVPMDLAYTSTIEELNAIDVLPTQGAFGIEDARVIDPGDPTRSTLFYRMATNGAGHMPKVWTRDNDREGLILLHDWIASLGKGDALKEPVKESSEGTETTVAALRRFTELLKLNPRDPNLVIEARQRSLAGDPITVSLFDRFLPPEERRKRLGDDIDRDRILALVGQAGRGRARFFGDASQQCILCHRLQGQGRDVGPDLDGIGAKRTPAELLESVLLPSKLVDPKYTTHLILVDDGTLVSGLKIEDTQNDLLIRSADGKDHRISKASIESHRLQSESLMPAGLAAEMTAEELADLLAFLSSLK